MTDSSSSSAPPPPPPPPPAPKGGRAAKPKKKGGEVDPAHKTPWRDNLEAAAMAILLALFLKAFLVEAYKIPSGSMQPTLMGMPTAGERPPTNGPMPEVKDRILVDKLTPRLRDPERWQVMVFRYPLKRTQNFVKRLVGMPGELLRIAGGDIHVRADADQEWSVPRRPRRVQEAHWREVSSPTGARTPWQQTRGQGWSVDADRIEARGDGAARFGDGSPVLNLYFDGYPESVRDRLPARFPAKERNQPVGDLRLSGELRPNAEVESVIFTLTEGLRRYRFFVPGPAADPQARAAIEVEPASVAADSIGRSVSETAGLLRAGRAVSFEVENLDDRLTLRIDGEEVAALPISAAADQQATVSFDLIGGELALDGVKLERDIFYFADRRNEFEIPAGHYLMLGDNTLNSSDGREWQAARFASLDDPERELVGNLRGDDNPTVSVRDPEAGSYFGFVDQWGTRHLLQTDTSRAPETPPDWLERAVQLEPEPFPFVERDLIVGRALAVFWPISPLDGVVRLKWVD